MSSASFLISRIPLLGEFTCQNAVMAERFIEAGSAYVSRKFSSILCFLMIWFIWMLDIHYVTVFSLIKNMFMAAMPWSWKRQMYIGCHTSLAVALDLVCIPSQTDSSFLSYQAVRHRQIDYRLKICLASLIHFLFTLQLCLRLPKELKLTILTAEYQLDSRLEGKLLHD